MPSSSKTSDSKMQTRSRSSKSPINAAEEQSKNSEMSENSSDDAQMEELRQGIKEIFNYKNISRHKYMALYTAVYNICTVRSEILVRRAEIWSFLRFLHVLE